MKHLTLGGRLTRDSELKEVNGTPLLSFAVAVDDRQKVNGEWVKGALFFDCSWWGPRAAAAHSYLVRGKSVCVTGEFGVREYDKKDGSRGHALDLRVDNLTFMGGREDGAGAGGGAPQGQGTGQGGGRYAGQGSPPNFGGAPRSAPPRQAPQQGQLDDDDIPF